MNGLWQEWSQAGMLVINGVLSYQLSIVHYHMIVTFRGECAEAEPDVLAVGAGYLGDHGVCVCV